MKKRIIALSILITVAGTTPLLSPKLKTKLQVKQEIHATQEEKKRNKSLAKQYAWAGYGWRNKEWNCIDYIFTKESRYDHLAKNKQGSSAFGIGQRLNENSKDPTIQILHAYKYIVHRYKTPCNAMRYHLRHNHY